MLDGKKLTSKKDYRNDTNINFDRDVLDSTNQESSIEFVNRKKVSVSKINLLGSNDVP